MNFQQKRDSLVNMLTVKSQTCFTQYKFTHYNLRLTWGIFFSFYLLKRDIKTESMNPFWFGWPIGHLFQHFLTNSTKHFIAIHIISVHNSCTYLQKQKHDTNISRKRHITLVLIYLKSIILNLHTDCFNYFLNMESKNNQHQYILLINILWPCCKLTQLNFHRRIDYIKKQD